MESIRIVPFKVNFDVVRKVDFCANILLWIAVLLAISLLIIGKIMTSGKEVYLDNVSYLLGVISLFYFLTDLAKRFFLQLAEQRRRKDFIDNSLKTNLSDFRSEGYFSNDDLAPGVHKLGLNCFESSFFSMTISRKMIWPLILKSAVIFAIICSVVMTSSKITIATCMQLALPYAVLQQTLVIIIYYFQVKSIFNYFILLFSSAQEEKRNHLLIHNVINYESTISWAGVILSNNLYEKLNDELSQQWEQIKADHEIKN